MPILSTTIKPIPCVNPADRNPIDMLEVASGCHILYDQNPCQGRGAAAFEFCREVTGGVVMPPPDDPFLSGRDERDSLSDDWYMRDCVAQN